MRNFFVGLAVVSFVAYANGADVADASVLAIAKYPDAKRAMVSLTFDDGTWDHYAIAAPLLEKYGYRGIFCIIPERLGHRKYMNWDKVKDLKARGHEIANHSMSHPNLVQVLADGNTNELKRQIVDSLGAFEENAGFKPTVFCFPYTAFNEDLYKLVLESGQQPMMRLRFVFVTKTTDEEFRAYLDKVVSRGQFKGLLFHGIAPKGRGWEPFADAAGFEAVLQELKSREDDVHVGGYSANLRYSELQKAAELVLVNHTRDKTTYRLSLKEGIDGLAGELTIVLGATPLNGVVGKSTEPGTETPGSEGVNALPDFTKILVGNQTATLQTNTLGVVYFTAALGDTITLMKPNAPNDGR